MHMHHEAAFSLIDFVIVTCAVLLGMMYVYAATKTNWSVLRIMLWLLGLVCAAVVMVGPLAEQMHHHFTTHMYGHLLLGMLAPFLLVLAAPITLLLRTLPVKRARQVSKLMNSSYIRFISYPITALVLNTGGLWLLYRTDLFQLMHHYTWLHYIIHFHIFAAGYLFTAVMLQVDPVRHPFSFKYRAIVMMVSIALHQILSKSFYPYPPTGVSKVQGEAGAMIMYYGGDLIELAIIFMMCLSWYHSVRPGKQKKMLFN